MADYRGRIIAAYREQAVKGGFSRVTVDDLVEQTGISKRTIYRYFSGKDEIVESVVNDFLKDLSHKIEAALDPAAGPVEQISNVIRVITGHTKLVEPMYLYDLNKYYPHLWERIEQFRAERIQKVFDRFFDSGGRDFFRETHPKILTTALLASIRAVVNPRFIIENQLNMEDTIESLFDVFLYGIVKK